MKKFIVSAVIPFMFGCAVKESNEVKAIDYSLYDEIYEKLEQKDIEKVKGLKEEHKTILNVPKYIKVYRGSYKDENGNVVAGGMEFIKVDNGSPDTNF